MAENKKKSTAKKVNEAKKPLDKKIEDTVIEAVTVDVQTDKVEEVKAIEPSDEEIEKVLESTDDVVIVDKKEEEPKEEKHKHEDAKPTSFKHKLQGYFGYLWNGQVMD